MADEQAMADVREAHAWATQELATAMPGSIREYCLTEERKRLAGIAWSLKTGRTQRYLAPPYEQRRAEYLTGKQTAGMKLVNNKTFTGFVRVGRRASLMQID